jgi:MYXO-CTERM domain-containing protein
MSDEIFVRIRVACRGMVGLLVVFTGFAILATPALALDGSWNVDTDGNYNDTANWLGGTLGIGNGFTATFANDITATRTVTLETTGRAIGNLVFGDANPSSSAGWVLARTGSVSLTINNLANTGLITVNDLGSNATTISLPLGSANTPVIEKNGVGTLVFSNASNPFTASLAVTAGTLQVSSDGNLGAIGAFATDRITLSSGGTLKTTASFSMNANRGITVGTGGGVLNITGGSLTYPARFTGSGNTLATSGSAGLSLTNTTGTPSDVNWDLTGSGTRIFFNSTDALGSGSVTVRNNVRLVSQSAAIGTVSNAITLDSGAGLAARTGAATFSGVVFPSLGTVVLNRDDQTTFGLTISSNATLAGDLTVDTSQQAANAVGDVTLSGIFSGASGGITKAGTGASGRLILGGANTYSGNTTISTGTLALGSTGSIANSPVISVGSGATFDVSSVAGFATGASQELGGSGTVTGAVAANGTISPGVASVASGVGTISFANDLSLASGSILGFQLDGSDFTVGGAVNDLITASGSLTLDGVVNVTALNSFASATVGNTWRLMNYSGTLTDNGLTLGSMPALGSGLAFSLDTATANQVNLVVTAVPEPATLVSGMIGLSGLGLAAARRRRSRSRC